MKGERKKYNCMEPVLHMIHKDYIILPNKDVKRNRGVLKLILQKIIKEMKQIDNLFETSFKEVFYGGSFYDGLMVRKLEEIDLNLLLTLPEEAKPSFDITKTPGFVQMQLNNFENFQKTPEAEDWSELFKFLNNQHYLMTSKVFVWVQGILQKALHKFPQCHDDRSYRIFKSSHGTFKGKIQTEQSVCTLILIICGAIRTKPVTIKINIIPCFKFGGDKWPLSFRPNTITNKPDFFVSPKMPYIENMDCFWRLSFQTQEHEFMKNKFAFKPTLRLFKKLQENLYKDALSSYCIKTIFLWELDKDDSDLWKGSHSYVFVTMLKRYMEYLEKRRISYFWNEENNFLEDKENTILHNLSYRLGHVITAIEDNLDNPYIIAEYLCYHLVKIKKKENRFRFNEETMMQKVNLIIL